MPTQYQVLGYTDTCVIYMTRCGLVFACPLVNRIKAHVHNDSVLTDVLDPQVHGTGVEDNPLA
jgi:hypothetical protein